MIDSLTDRLDAFAARHERLFGIAGAAFLALSTAIYARFIELPRFDWLSERALMIASMVYNAIWWGFAYPRIEQRRKARAKDEVTA